ncbi:hypothetical protein [Streptomyces sp. NPDC059805]|jgi:hypothetical protein|uniref:hypothetical protein n=1 Tax=unclassified Streptomyces TaxID=2593676 RepID=UPI003651FC4C
MTEVELVAAALAAGASAGLTDTARGAVTDLYTSLREAVRRCLDRGAVPGARVLDAPDADTGAWQSRLVAVLSDSGLERDPAVLALARALLDETRKPGRITVDASNARGVQIGDNNQQHNAF